MFLHFALNSLTKENAREVSLFHNSVDTGEVTPVISNKLAFKILHLLMTITKKEKLLITIILRCNVAKQ